MAFELDRIVAYTVIRMTLAYFCVNDTHLKKNLKSLYLGQFYSYSDVIMHSHTAQNDLTG